MARYIDADALLLKIDLHGTNKFGMLDEDIREFVKQIPTADVAEVKHSSWILHPDGSGTCNNCQCHQKLIWDYDNWQEFCGRCGAKMDEKR